MIKREQVDRIELPVEQLSYTSPPADHLYGARRLWTTAQRATQAAAAQRAAAATSSASNATVTTTTFTRSTTFRRLVDVPGESLDTTLEAWWSRSSHDDGHLRLDQLSSSHGLHELVGTLRLAALSRRIPVEIRLSPYLGSWSFLELTPQRPTHGTRIYFRTGHDSLDRFVAALCALV
jgi:hypothetical protein